MEFTARQIAELLHGAIEGNPDITVDRLSRIEEGGPGSLTFLANPKYTQFIYKTSASVIIVQEQFEPEHPISATLIRVADPYISFAELLEYYNQLTGKKSGISSLAYIAPTAQVGDDVYIGEFASIGENAVIGDHTQIYPQVYIGDNSKVGRNTLIYAGVKIYSDNIIGAGCTIHSGVVIGSDGFGFAPQEDNNYKKIAQIGNVVIEDDVEIGANTTIDRATLGSTIIRKGVKLDNLIQIAHNVEVGENTVIAAQTGISGSSRIGKNCLLGGQVGVAGHLLRGDNNKLGAQSGIGKNTREGAIMWGSPAFDMTTYRKSYIHFRNLEKIVARIDALEKKV